jgi:hypothetical protein
MFLHCMEEVSIVRYQKLKTLRFIIARCTEDWSAAIDINSFYLRIIELTQQCCDLSVPICNGMMQCYKICQP